jgi:hypothetical protein
MKKIRAALGALRLQSPFRLARKLDPENPLHELTDEQLAEAIIRQAADAGARLAILTGDQAPPRGFGVASLKGPRLRLALAAKESLQAALEGLREVYGRARG